MLLNKQAINLALANNAMNIKDLAAVTGITVSAISKGLNGPVHMRLKNIGLIAKALDLPVEQITLKEN